MPSQSQTYSRSLELFDEAITRIPGGSQTGSKRPAAFAYGAYPIYFASGQGSRVTDIDGNTYIDLVSALGPITLGYTYPEVDQAIRDQLGRGIISGLLSPLEVEVARQLQAMVPCAEMVRYFKGGGEATAAAARLARLYTGRSVILNCGYRGWPDIWGIEHNDGGIPKGAEYALQPFRFNDREGLERIIHGQSSEIAAIAIDVQLTQPEPGYLAWLRDLAHEIGALLIFDEIVTGFRLANGGAQEYFDVTPDLAVFAKGIANGMPLAVVAGRAEVMSRMADAHISITYGGEALSLAAANATLEIYRREPVVETLRQRGEQLRNGLTEAASNAGLPFEVIGFDPMTGMRFEGLEPAEESDAWSYLLQEFAERGVLLRRGGLNFISYSHSADDIAEVIEVANSVFPNLAALLKTHQVQKHLRVRSTAPSFRTFQ